MFATNKDCIEFGAVGTKNTSIIQVTDIEQPIFQPKTIEAGCSVDMLTMNSRCNHLAYFCNNGSNLFVVSDIFSG